MSKHVPIRQQVVTLMESKGVSQSELARETGVMRDSINRYVNGLGDLNTETADKLLEYLKKIDCRP